MKKISILFILLSVLFLTSCNNMTSTSQKPPTHKTNENTQVENQAETLTNYLTFLDKDMEGYEQLLESPLLKKAVEEKAVISLNNNVLTNIKEVSGYFYIFTKKAKDIEFNLYEFRVKDNSYSLLKKEIALKDGKATVKSCYTGDWEKLGDETQVDNYPSYGYNYYNRLLFKDESGEIVSSAKIYSDNLLYNDDNHDVDYPAILKDKRKYIDPIFNNCTTEFSSDNISPGFGIFCFEDLYKYETGNKIYDEYEDGNIPISVIKKTLKKYFNIPQEDIINEIIEKYSSLIYDEKNETVNYESGRGDLIASVQIRSVEEKNNMKYLTYDCVDFVTGVPYERYVMTVKDKPFGGFKYISIKKIGSTNNPENQDFIDEISEVLKRSATTFLQFRGCMECDEDADPIFIRDLEFYPSKEFFSIKELKEYTEKTFSKSFAIEQLYDSFTDDIKPWMVEKDGKLYVHNGGFGWAYVVIPDSVMITDITDTTATIQMDSSFFGITVEIIEFNCVKENGRWVLDNYYFLK